MSLTLSRWHIEHAVASLAQSFPALTLQQEHTGEIIRAGTTTSPVRGDGWLVTPADPSVAIATADCAPVVLTTATQACVLHVSRHTLLRDIIPQALKQLALQKIVGLYIGPHICERHFLFEYEGEEILAFKKRYPGAGAVTPRGTALSLRRALQQDLAAVLQPGAVLQHIDQRCTYETAALPSYRRWLERSKQGSLPRLYTVVTAPPTTGKA